MVSPEEIRRAGLGVSGRSISFLTSAQRLQVARADTLLPRETGLQARRGPDRDHRFGSGEGHEPPNSHVSEGRHFALDFRRKRSMNAGHGR